MKGLRGRKIWKKGANKKDSTPEGKRGLYEHIVTG